MRPDVTVVIPAYNAVRTLERTLDSAAGQTLRNIEILVVDDGSTDQTAQLVRARCHRDSRIRLLTQSNAGVASARNHGIQAAAAELVAPLDADDLWHPTKLEKQLAAVRASRERLGFVYCAFRAIDDDDRVFGHRPNFRVRGRALQRHLLVNFVGNGSTPLMYRSDVLELGGYDPSFRHADLEGLEDYWLQLQLASRLPIDVVPEYLVGYRKHAHSMSADASRMARSFLKMQARAQAEWPHVPRRVFDQGAGAYLLLCGLQCVVGGGVRAGGELVKLAFEKDARGAAAQFEGVLRDRMAAGASSLATLVLSRLKPSNSAEIPRKHFYEYSPTDERDSGSHDVLIRRLHRLETHAE